MGWLSSKKALFCMISAMRALASAGVTAVEPAPVWPGISVRGGADGLGDVGPDLHLGGVPLALPESGDGLVRDAELLGHGRHPGDLLVEGHPPLGLESPPARLQGLLLGRRGGLGLLGQDVELRLREASLGRQGAKLGGRLALVVLGLARPPELCPQSIHSLLRRVRGEVHEVRVGLQDLVHELLLLLGARLRAGRADGGAHESLRVAERLGERGGVLEVLEARVHAEVFRESLQPLLGSTGGWAVAVGVRARLHVVALGGHQEVPTKEDRHRAGSPSALCRAVA